MASSSDIAEATPPARFVAERIIAWHWRWSVCLAIALFIALLFSVGGFHAWLIPESVEGRAGIGRRVTQMNVVLSVVSAYTLGAGLIGLGAATRLFEKLRPLYVRSEHEFDAMRDQLFPANGAIIMAALAGGLFGLALWLSPYLYLEAARVDANPRGIGVTIVLFSLLGIMALITICQSRMFSRVGRDEIEIDLLNPSALSPFAAFGLMSAATWFIGSALASFLVVNGANALIVALIIVVTTGLGVAGLVVPSRGLHARLEEVKSKELCLVRNAIALERADLLDAGELNAPPPRMHALLAYEARIESVREWPFDTSTLGRFGFFLLIPLFSWIGGALVERAVDAALN